MKKEPTIKREQNLFYGVVFGILSTLAFAIMSVFVKLIGTQLPTIQLIFARFVISFLLLLPFIFTDAKFNFRIREPLRYFFRIIFALTGLFLVFYAVKLIPLVDALLLNNTAPLFVPLVALIITGAKTPLKAIGGIVIGFIGVAVILQPGKEIFSLPSILALLSGLLAAIAIVLMRLLTKTSTTKQMLFYYFFVSTVLSGLIALPYWSTPTDLRVWLFLLGIGVFGGLYQLFATLSYAIAPVRLMSSLMFLIVLFGGVFDWLIWSNLPNFATVVGGILVIIGAMFTIYFGQKGIQLNKSR